jgi:hypothetical protein
MVHPVRVEYADPIVYFSEACDMLHYNEYGLDKLGKGFTCSARVHPRRIL